MSGDDLVAALKSILPEALARDLATAFLEMRRDVATVTLGRSSPGKFVETIVQALQHLHGGTFDAHPDVDAVLRNADNLKVDDGLRICAARLARGMYSLRSKRNIAHKGPVDPNVYDLRLLFAGAQWVMAELIRLCSAVPMAEAGRLVDLVQAPVTALVEVHDQGRLVLADVPARDEILVLLHSCYPESMPRAAIAQALERRAAKTVSKAIRELWTKKSMTEGAAGCRLTQRGHSEAEIVVARLLRTAAA
ncbi:MAG TPA: hypothetical protein VKH41_16445 [Myxococcota bacterium]|nr:hypothetical protein [Myxococcota bacterium]